MTITAIINHIENIYDARLKLWRRRIVKENIVTESRKAIFVLRNFPLMLLTFSYLLYNILNYTDSLLYNNIFLYSFLNKYPFTKNVYNSHIRNRDYTYIYK